MNKKSSIDGNLYYLKIFPGKYLKKLNNKMPSAEHGFANSRQKVDNFEDVYLF